MQTASSISKIARSYGCTPPAIHYILKRNRQRPEETGGQPMEISQPVALRPPSAPALVRSNMPDRGPAAALRADERRPPETPRQPATEAGRGAAASGLDHALHHRAEAAIEMFRSSFDAVLEQGSPELRERLRQAAADLMRVAARTTIVLDRLSAGAERPGRAQSYPRSALVGEG